MACLFLDSCDTYATADILLKWNAHSNFTITANGRKGTNALTMTATGAVPRAISKSFAANTNACIVGAAYKTAFVGTPDIFSIQDGATQHVTLWIDATGVMKVSRGAGSGGTNLGTCSMALQANAYYYIELKAKIDDTVGTVDVQVDGINVLSLTGVDTRNAASAQWTTVSLMNYGINTTGWLTYYDDLYVCDSSGAVNNNFLGPITIKATLADAAGATTNMTPTPAVANYLNIDDPTYDGDTTYVAETTVGEFDTYNFAALGVTGVVKAVQVNLLARSAGSGGETIAPMYRIGGVNYTGTAQAIGTGYLTYREVRDTSPATAVAWTVAEIDGAEFGCKLVS